LIWGYASVVASINESNDALNEETLWSFLQRVS